MFVIRFTGLDRVKELVMFDVLPIVIIVSSGTKRIVGNKENSSKEVGRQNNVHNYKIFRNIQEIYK